MRMFIGIKLSEEAVSRIEKLQNIINVEGSMTNPNNLHLTLVFLGEVNDEERKVVEKILDEIDFPSFKIDADRVEMLRDMVVLSIEENITLNDLQETLMKKLISHGFKIKKRKYRPHITLVRKSDKMINFNFKLNEIANEIILFSSEQIDGKLVYKNKYAAKLKKV